MLLIWALNGEGPREWLPIWIGVYAAPFLPPVALFFLSWDIAFFAVSLWLTAEVVFWLICQGVLRRVNRYPTQIPLPDLAEGRMLLSHFLKMRNDVDIHNFLSRWFLGAPYERIRLQNMREFVAHGFYHRPLSELSAAYQEAVDEHVREVEAAWGIKFQEGMDSGIAFMAHTREPLRVIHHPLFVYIWGYYVGILTGIILRLWGFQRYSTSALSYWYRPPGKDAKTPRTPRVFFHGLGIGAAPYLMFLDQLLNTQDQAAVIVELPHVALRWCPRIPTVEHMVSGLEQIHLRHSLGAANYIGHSYGSLPISRLLRVHPGMVKGVALLDPVCFLLFLPDVIFNFVYRGPAGENASAWFSDFLRWFFLSRELQISQALCRGFNWHQMTLWQENLPADVVVLLSAKDQVVPAEHIRVYLEKSEVHVIWYKDLRHGGFLLRPESQQRIVEVVDSWG